MVGVGPGVGADVIRQRRKRADKLRKEQQVEIINVLKINFETKLQSYYFLFSNSLIIQRSESSIYMVRPLLLQ